MKGSETGILCHMNVTHGVVRWRKLSSVQSYVVYQGARLGNKRKQILLGKQTRIIGHSLSFN